MIWKKKKIQHNKLKLLMHGIYSLGHVMDRDVFKESK